MSRRTQKNVGVIGLGIIGRRVADNLRRRGFHVFVWNRTPRPYPNFVGSPSEVAELCDFVQIFVSDDDALLQMVQEMKPAFHVQHVIMAHSTVAPHTMRNAAEIVQRRGAHFLDAPFTGSKGPAEKGELVYYVAGDDAAYRRARPVLEASSKEIIEIGEIGQATTVKLATNMVTAATVQAAAEALALVHNSGLALETFATALRGNASNSGTLAMKLPKMIEGDFEPHFSVKHMLKDVQIATRLARSHGLTFGATEAARDSLIEEAQNGRADADFSALIHAFFPDGVPAEQEPEADEEDAQAKLASLEEEAVAQVPRSAPQAGQADLADKREARNEEVLSATPVAQDAKATTEARSDTPRRNEEAWELDTPTDEDEPAPGLADDIKRDIESAPAADKDEAAPSLSDESTREIDVEPATEEPAALEEKPQPVRSEAEPDRPQAAVPETPEPAPSSDRDEDDEKAEALPVEDEQREEPKAAAADPVARETPELASLAAPAVEPGPEAEVDDILHGEPPRDRRPNGERAGGEPSRQQDEVTARRGFLSRMFGKGSDY